ncbi:MAG TPA: BA14K family protein [Pseudorhizobium sp.]|nr:BA14K family protein [Pseudorhizobium sp.]
MKSFLSLILGVAMAVALFVGGVAASSWMMQDPEPHHFAHLDERPLWTNKPVAVDPQEQNFERLAAAPVPPVFQAMAVELSVQEKERLTATVSTDDNDPGVDMTATGAIEPESSMEFAGTQHAQWCSDRYRSYRAEDNSYQPYEGPRKQCESPYLLREETIASNSQIHQPQTDGDSAHITWCFERYRSYRPADNTYQPYHGPRRACESPFG